MKNQHLRVAAVFGCFISRSAREERGIKFEFQDHEISHSIYFRDPDGHALEITTYDL